MWSVKTHVLLFSSAVDHPGNDNFVLYSIMLRIKPIINYYS